MNPSTLPTLETERLKIRPFAADDLGDVYRIIDCDCFGQRQPDDLVAKQRRRDWLDWNIAGAKEQASLGQPPYGDRAIVQKSSGQMVGICGLVPSFGPFRRLIDGIESCEANSPEVGLFYAVASEHRRQRYAIEANRALIQFAFESLKLHRIVATTEADNTASIEVIRRLDFTIRQNTHAGFPEVVGFLTNPREIPPSPAFGRVGKLNCRQATLLDVPLLAAMNEQLIQDEGSRNPMSLVELKERMRGWLASNWQAVVVEMDSEAVGYLLFQFRSDDYRPSDVTVYVRQFFIGRNLRGRGIGRQAFNMIREQIFSEAAAVVLEVLEVNSQARRFWVSLGFKPYSTTMKLIPL